MKFLICSKFAQCFNFLDALLVPRIGAERAYLRGVGKIQINGKLTSQEAHVEFLCPR